MLGRPYTIPENAFLAYQRGAGQRYHDLAMRFLANSWYYNPLAKGENVLPGKHAYSHVNCLSSAMQASFMLADEKYLQTAQNGFDFVRMQSFATGGWGPNEEFRKPSSGEVGESLTTTHSSFETPCGSYAHFKITRYLIRATQDSRYGGSIERVLYNCIEAVDPQHPDLLAVVHGPLALFSVGEVPASLTKQKLLAATRVAAGSTDWQAKTAAGSLTLRPFARSRMSTIGCI